MFGIIEFGRILNGYNQLTQLAGQGARAATVNRNPDGTAVAAASGTVDDSDCGGKTYSIQCQLSKYYAKNDSLSNVKVCIHSLPASPGGACDCENHVPLQLHHRALRLRTRRPELDPDGARRGDCVVHRGRSEWSPLLMDVAAARNSERGAVIVMVAVWLPVLAIFASFAIDVAHFFDYSRNLQNRADAFALAAGLEYGNTCAATTPDPTATAAIGKAGQLYSGPGSTSDLPYPYSTWPAAQYKNIPNLTAGTLDHYHVVVNGSGPWHAGQISNGNWPGHSGTTASFTHGTVCAASYADDQGGATGPITDVWVTQDSLPLFFPLFGFHPVDLCPRPSRASTGDREQQHPPDRGSRRSESRLCDGQLLDRRREPHPDQDDDADSADEHALVEPDRRHADDADFERDRPAGPRLRGRRSRL